MSKETNTPHCISNNDLFSQSQIRLTELSVYNWGSFHGLHTANIDRYGTLITGDNGSGKSTLIDGLMALLLPAGKAAFNVAAAQGDRSDRSLLSYMRGSFGSAHDGSNTRVKSKREKGVVTGLRALYRGDDGTYVTLAALFWTTGATNALSDVKRIYIVAKKNLTLKEVLDAFGDGSARKLKQWIKDNPAIECCDDRFSDYQELYRKLLYMDNKNAPALLSRALGLKKIDDLTKLIRELVLEPSNVKGDVKKVVDEFSDLVAIHDQVKDAQEQCTHLSRLPELANAIADAKQSLDSLWQEKQDLPVYFGEVLSILWKEELDKINTEINEVAGQIKNAQVDEQDAQASVEKRHADYLNLGGDKIEPLKKDIEHLKSKLNDIIRASSSYQSTCQKLDLDPELSEDSYSQNIKVMAERLVQINDETEKSQDHFAEIAGQHSAKKSELNLIRDEIREIEARPDSNIDVRYQKLRDNMADSLEISNNELIFIGELIDVKEDEKPWQGAIERALGGLKTTLLVPRKSYSMVTRWLNVRHTGLHVRVQVVSNDETKSSAVNFKENGFLRKLIWKDHRYRDWTKAFLTSYDLQCVSGTDELDITPFSMTKEGLIHKEHGRFEKKDQNRVDDRRKWNLGFSNKSRLSILLNDQRAIEQTLSEFESKLAGARESLNKVSDEKDLWKKLQSYEWEQINAPFWQKRYDNAKAELARHMESEGDLKQARILWEDAKRALLEIQQEKSTLLVRKGSLEKDQHNANQEHEKAQKEAETGMSDISRSRLEQRVGKVTLDNKDKLSQIERELDRELEKVRTKKSASESTANGIMGSFRGKDKWHPITVDWPSGLDGLQDHLDHYDHLKKEGLPDLVDRFKERLNKHATQSLAQIQDKLNSERDDIYERIETINQVLKRTEFKQGSFLRLVWKKEKYPHVQDFERKLTRTLGQMTSDDHESRFQLLAEVVDILEKASTPGTSHTLESMRLLDPRYQMSFCAEEVDSATLTIRDVLESSSGKSGGEKEAFAGTIVAASLAYVLTPKNHHQPVYCTVFLDEAFSNTAEDVSRKVLRVFKELNIHVNLITPFKNLNLSRESARSLLIAERDPVLHESRLCEVTWEEIDRKRDQQQRASLKDAEALGIDIQKAKTHELQSTT